MADPKEKRVELILQQLEQLPTLPTVAVRVLEVVGKDETSTREVVDLICSDPALSSKILRAVRRADVGVRGEVSSVERAVVLLGFEAVRSAVLAVSVFGLFGGEGQGTHFKREEFWKHSVAVACAAEALAEAKNAADGKNVLDPSEAFVCGLLHDLGKMALDAMLPKSFDRVVEAVDLLRGNIADLERQVIGIDHMVVGKRLAERWQLPISVRDCIWLHGQNPQALPATVKNALLVNVITLADAMAREQHLGYSGNHVMSAFRPALTAAIGVSEQAIRAIQADLINKVAPRSESLGLGRTSSGELYLSALSQANHELGRMGEQLASKNRRLAVRAKFFDALSRFQGELRPDAPPQLVMGAIGQTAVGALSSAPAAVFSVLPGQTFAEVMLVDEHGECVGTSVVDCPGALARPGAGDGPVLSAGPELEWLLADVSPKLAGQQRFWICLEADGACVGGVVWGAASGESQRLSPQALELTALAGGWSLALRTAQIREESRTLSEQLAETNRQLQSAQQELIRSRTLVSVGEMAAGAAHEMNNPLAVISGRSQLLASQLTDLKLKHAASTIAEQSHRLSEMITDLMEFAKPVPPKVESADVADLLERAIYSARSANDVAGRKIELTLEDVPPVNVDRQQIENAIAQILHNALQATDDNTGRILVHAAYDTFSSRVAIRVEDNGCGMDDETLRRAFDPFFSSLRAGRRRGMGLAKALRWVESSGGTIRLESRPKQGTRAMILLPAAAQISGAATQTQQKKAIGNR